MNLLDQALKLHNPYDPRSETKAVFTFISKLKIERPRDFELCKRLGSSQTPHLGFRLLYLIESNLDSKIDLNEKQIKNLESLKNLFNNTLEMIETLRETINNYEKLFITASNQDKF